jgi:hypothetical protein
MVTRIAHGVLLIAIVNCLTIDGSSVVYGQVRENRIAFPTAGK